MEDFVVLSLVDLEAAIESQQEGGKPTTSSSSKKQDKIQKSQINCYVMMGNECIDSLIFGSPNAQIQEPTLLDPNVHQASGGAAGPDIGGVNNDEERGSCDNSRTEAPTTKKQTNRTTSLAPSLRGTKKTKIPIYGQKSKTLQIVINSNGKRVGSVSFSLKKLQQGSGKRYMHWATLFDELDDDLFESQLGEDEQDTPRVLLEYQIVSSQVTSVVGKLEQTGVEAQQSLVNMNRRQNEIEEHAQEMRRNRQQQVPVEVVQVIEFNESRAQKLRGEQNGFQGKFLNEKQKDHYLKFSLQDAKDSSSMMTKAQQEENQKVYEQLQASINQYEIMTKRRKYLDDCDNTLLMVQQTQASSDQQHEELQGFMDNLIQNHQDEVGKQQKDLITHAFDSYHVYLEEIEERDLKTLTERKKQLISLKKQITVDTEDAERDRLSLLSRRQLEQDSLRGTAANSNQIKELISQIGDTEQDLDAVKQEAREAYGDQAQENFLKVAPGCDHLNKQNNKLNKDFYTKVTGLYKELHLAKNKKFESDQMMINHQMKNLLLEEEIDEQIDKKVVLKLEVQQTNRDTERVMKKIETFLREGEGILREKLNDIDDLGSEVKKLTKDREKLIRERDKMRKKYLELEAERMKTRLQAERESEVLAREFKKQDTRKDEIGRAHDNIDNSMRMISTKLPLPNQRISSSEANQERRNLQNQLAKLKSLQSQVLNLQKAKQNVEDQKMLLEQKGGVKGKVSQAVDHLTMFTQECQNETEEMKNQLNRAQTDLNKKQQLVSQQEDEIKNSQKELQVTLAHLDKARQGYISAVPKRQAQANTKDLQSNIALKEQRIQALAQQLAGNQSPRRIFDQAIDKAVEQALKNSKSQRMHQHTFEKLASGVYLADGETVVTVSQKLTGQFVATYLTGQGQEKQVPLEEFLSLM